MRTLLLILALCLCGVVFSQQRVWKPLADAARSLDLSGLSLNPHEQPLKQTGTSSSRVDMYSLSTCAPCKIMARELDAAGIFYVDYIIDQEPDRQEELSQRLSKAGIAPGVHSVPIMFVGKHVFMGRTPVATIEAAMQE